MTDKELQDQRERVFSPIDQPVAGPWPAEVRVANPARPEWSPFAAGPEPAWSPQLGPVEAEVLAARPPQGIHWRLLLWLVFAALAVLSAAFYGWSLIFNDSPGPDAAPAAQVTPRFVMPVAQTPSATPTPLKPPSPGATAGSGGFSFAQATATPTPVANGRVLVLTPAARDLGWVVSDDESIVTEFDLQNHFGDSYLYAGQLNGQTYRAGLQFDLRRVPRGTEIYAASLKLTGLRADQLAGAGRGGWQVRLLDPAIDERWRDHSYTVLSQTEGLSSWPVPAEMLAEGGVAVFEFSDEQLALLAQRIFEGNDQFGRQISFRLDGPESGPNNLFAWDSGYGPASKGAKPELFLSLGPPPAETPEPYYVVITSTPTPLTIETAVALSVKMTAQAKLAGTATPLPRHWVTPVVVTPTPPVADPAVAARLAARATAIALTTGEPPNLATATATPTYIIITATPTPLTLETAAVQAAAVTAAAVRYGTATPFPDNWVTPAVVVSTPTPENTATATYYWAVAMTTGTPTPTPGNVQTATPTPVSIVPTVSPTTTPTPSPTFQPVPAELVGQIVFLSDREGSTEEQRLQADRRQATPTVEPQPYVFDPATGAVRRLTDLWPYASAALRDAWSADGRLEAYTQQLLWAGNRSNTLALHFYDHEYLVETQITDFGRGAAWDPAWSPVSEQIAFVSNDSGDDEIWVINRDGSNPVRLTETNEAFNGAQIGKDDFLAEVNGHPSWSPDGSQLVFWSNRSGNQQLWLMNADGSDERLLMDPTGYNDRDPVWIKTTTPPPSLQRQPDWRFVKPE